MPVKTNWERDHLAEPIILSNFKDIQGSARVIRFVRKTVTIGRHVRISNTLSTYTCILTIVAKNPDRKLKHTIADSSCGHIHVPLYSFDLEAQI